MPLSKLSGKGLLPLKKMGYSFQEVIVLAALL
jgi:hypothetical protein